MLQLYGSFVFVRRQLLDQPPKLDVVVVFRKTVTPAGMLAVHEATGAFGPQLIADTLVPGLPEFGK